MHDVGAILGSAFRGTLDELREQYQRLEALEPQARDRVIADANASLVAVKDAISAPETSKAKDVLLAYQFITRFGYDVDAKSQRHFVDALRRLWRGQKNEIAHWNWQAPSRDEFFSAVRSRLPSVDFYTQVNLLCDELFGISLPSSTENSLLDWSKRVGLSEAGWGWSYDNQIKEEQGRWFTSQKRIIAIEAKRTEHRAKSAQCTSEIAPIFSDLYPAKSRLEDLKQQELWLSGQCLAMNRAAEALLQGVQLKHLLLEEAHDLGKAFNAATRGL